MFHGRGLSDILGDLPMTDAAIGCTRLTCAQELTSGQFCLSHDISGGTQEFSFGGCSPGSLGAEMSQWVQGRSPGRESGGEVQQKLKQFADTVCGF